MGDVSVSMPDMSSLSCARVCQFKVGRAMCASSCGEVAKGQVICLRITWLTVTQPSNFAGRVGRLAMTSRCVHLCCRQCQCKLVLQGGPLGASDARQQEEDSSVQRKGSTSSITVHAQVSPHKQAPHASTCEIGTTSQTSALQHPVCSGWGVLSDACYP